MSSGRICGSVNKSVMRAIIFAHNERVHFNSHYKSFYANVPERDKMKKCLIPRLHKSTAHDHVDDAAAADEDNQPAHCDKAAIVLSLSSSSSSSSCCVSCEMYIDKKGNMAKLKYCTPPVRVSL